MKWIKRVWMPLLCLLAVLMLTQPLRAEAAETVASGTCGYYLTWVLDSKGTLTISGTGGMKNYSGLSSAPWYYNNRSSIKTVVIREGVTSIGDNAFHSCSNLGSITIPESVTSIGDHAFSHCSGLTRITIPESVTSIGGGAFYNCSMLASINIPNGATSIGDYAFYLCDDLTHITIPESVTSIGKYAFYGCKKLTDVYYDGGIERWLQISIGSDNYYLTSATIHCVESDGIKHTYHTGTCGDALTWILSDNGTMIIFGTGEMKDYQTDAPWYSECSSITTVMIEEGITSIGDSAFYGCSSLTSISIPESVTSIGDSVFYGCSSLTSISIPESVTRIGKLAFCGCSSLTSITIPKSVTSIGGAAFYACSKLAEILVAESNENYTSVDGVLYNFQKTVLVAIPKGISGVVTIPDGITSIDDDAFYRCRKLTSVTIPEGVTSIGDSAFYGCSSLTSISIPESVTSIGDSAFYGCSSLTSITIPESVTSIGSHAFYDCTYLTSVTIPENVTSICEYAFDGCDSLTDVYYGSTVESWIQWTQQFSSSHNTCLTNACVHCVGNDGNIHVYIAVGTCREAQNWALDEEGILTISGTGHMEDYLPASRVPWYSYREKITAVEIGAGITGIGYNAFSVCCNLINLNVAEGNENYYSSGNCIIYTAGKTLEVGSSASVIPTDGGVISIGDHAFCGRTGLTKITIPQGVASIDYAAFFGCSNLSSIIIPESVTSIATYAFSGCSSLSDVYYRGTWLDWERIAIEDGNTCLIGATLHLFVPGTCSGSMGMHMVAVDKHVCDFCNEIVIECTDTDKNHVCDICGGTVGEHKAADGKHTCDYCGEKVSDCVDTDKNHKCDICGEAIGEHKAADGKHTCDYCGEKVSECVDTDPADHNCDICGEKLSECADENGDGKCDVCGAELEKPNVGEVSRIAGSGRWDTAIKTADVLKSELGVSKFSSVIVASGNDSADALAGSYLSAVKNAPILLSWGKGGSYDYLDTNNIDYIKNNLVSGGTVYILGGTSAVPTLYENKLSAYNVVRLGGGNRFETNQKILNEAGVAPGSEVLVCTAYNFADSLSASATGKPVLLVYTTEKGKNYGVDDAYLQSLSGCEFTIIGGKSAVSAGVEAILQSYGSVDRLAGGNRFETSVMVAERYFTNPDSAVLAYAWNYPDGLCGGALAYAMNAPLILTMDKYESAAKRYVQSTGISSGYILGGTGLISDATVRTIYALDPSTQIPLK